jgi:hypothetical protein
MCNFLETYFIKGNFCKGWDLTPTCSSKYSLKFLNLGLMTAWNKNKNMLPNQLVLYSCVCRYTELNVYAIDNKTGNCHLKTIVISIYKLNNAKEAWTGTLQHINHRWWHSICIYTLYLFIVYFTMLSVIKAINYSVEC